MEGKDLKEITSERIKELRINKGLKPVDVYTKLGIPKPSYFDYEYGRKMPSAKRLNSIALLLDTTVDYLQGLTDISTPTTNDLSEMIASILREKELVYKGKTITEKEAQKIITMLDTILE